jgi:hypothetical protein
MRSAAALALRASHQAELGFGRRIELIRDRFLSEVIVIEI